MLLHRIITLVLWLLAGRKGEGAAPAIGGFLRVFRCGTREQEMVRVKHRAGKDERGSVAALDGAWIMLNEVMSLGHTSPSR
jgi:hypothetical protein